MTKRKHGYITRKGSNGQVSMWYDAWPWAALIVLVALAARMMH